MALIPSHYLDAVAVLEEGDLTADPPVFTPIATGTLLGYKAVDQTGVEEGQYRRHLFLVTNRHVIEGKSELWIRFNQGATSQRFRLSVIDENGQDRFFVSPNFDVAICHFDGRPLREAGADFAALPNWSFLDMDGLQSAGIVGGDGVFVLGFPMGIAGVEKKYAIVRSGVVARLDQEIVDERGSFLIDCPVFPGNSGGPVILRPEMLTLGDSPGRATVHVIGIVAGYVPWVDMAISSQTGNPRITFEENSGLTNVIPMDAVNELVSPRLDLLEGTTETEDAPEDDPPESD